LNEKELTKQVDGARKQGKIEIKFKQKFHHEKRKNSDPK